MTNQIQKAGKDSNQIQVEKLSIHTGIEEKRVRQIIDEKISIITKELSSEAKRITQERINKFEEHLIFKLKQVENGFDAFADPSFQLALIAAQKSAAVSDCNADYEMLAELLVHRVKKAGNKKVKTGIKKAIEVVGDIDDDALLGLCLMYCVGNFNTSLTDIDAGLKDQDEFYGLLITEEIPSGISWIHQLELLNLVRVDEGTSFFDLVTININHKWKKYIESGILNDSENYKKAVEILESNGFNAEYFLIDHYFNNEYKMLINKTTRDICTVDKQKVLKDNRYSTNCELMEQKIEKCIEEVYNLYTQNSAIENQNKKFFTEKWNLYSNLNKLDKWWSNLSIPFALTAAGKVLAHAHIMKIDKEFPKFNYEEI